MFTNRKIEARAYRPALSPEQAADELKQQVRAGSFDRLRQWL